MSKRKRTPVLCIFLAYGSGINTMATLLSLSAGHPVWMLNGFFAVLALVGSIVVGRAS